MSATSVISGTSLRVDGQAWWVRSADPQLGFNQWTPFGTLTTFSEVVRFHFAPTHKSGLSLPLRRPLRAQPNTNH